MGVELVGSSEGFNMGRNKYYYYLGGGGFLL